MPNRAHAAWREARHRELAGPDSWLGLVGLVWLTPGSNTVGSDPRAAVRLPAGPARLGELQWQRQAIGERLVWRPAEGDPVELESDRHGQPTVVEAGSLSFFVVDRQGRLAVRVRDRAWAAVRPFAGVDCYPYSADWRISARWEALAAPLDLEVPDVTGDLRVVTVTRRAVFEAAGRSVSLLPTSVGRPGVFFVFRDGGSGRETYGAGRFLQASMPRGGRLILDFNRAYNPPCAFTPFATCPLPPPENRLPFAVPAGEKRYDSGEH